MQGPVESSKVRFTGGSYVNGIVYCERKRSNKTAELRQLRAVEKILFFEASDTSLSKGNYTDAHLNFNNTNVLGNQRLERMTTKCILKVC